MAMDFINKEANASARGLVDIIGFDIGGIDAPEMRQVTIKEINLGESLTTPGLQTSVVMQSFVYKPPGKNYDKFKNKPITFTLTNDLGGTLPVFQQVYRIDNRMFKPTNVGQTEEFTVHACDPSLLYDAQALVSQSWSCKTPDKIVSEVLQGCAGVRELDVEKCDPTRDYIAENIHPFQVVAQQSNVALVGGNDPSFVHFMTYRNMGTHHFRSLKKLTEEAPMMEFFQSETGLVSSGNYGNPNAAIAFSFPCDFDYLSDLLNGVDMNGDDKNSGGFINQVSKSGSLLGNQSKGGSGCKGIGGFNYKGAITNYGTEKEQQGCKFGVEKYLLKRQARMALLEKDKIALRIVVPWNADLHVGNIIRFTWFNKSDNNSPVYGSGDFLVSSLMHTIRLGGYSTTTMDCVSKTVGQGVAG